jgi:hypothetical protein
MNQEEHFIEYLRNSLSFLSLDDPALGKLKSNGELQEYSELNTLKLFFSERIADEFISKLNQKREERTQVRCSNESRRGRKSKESSDHFRWRQVYLNRWKSN